MTSASAALRVAAEMFDPIRRGFFKKEETILFRHTGGDPALFAEKYANEIQLFVML
jgi:D-cysteine desulfhydrase